MLFYRIMRVDNVLAHLCRAAHFVEKECLMPYMKLDSGIEMYIRETGPVEGETVLLIHGLGGRSIQWTSQIKTLANAGYRVIAADWPGHGGSTKGIDGFSFNTVIDGFDELMKKTGAGPDNRFAVAGHSAGGTIAQMLFHRNPESIGALILLQTGYSFFKFIPDVIKETAVGAFVHFLCEPSINKTINTGFNIAGDLASVFLGDEHPFVIMASVGIFDSSAEVSMAEYRALMDMDIESQLAGLKVPTCIIASRFDQIVPLGHAKRMHAQIPDSELHILSSIGHNGHVNNADKVNSLMLDFLGREFPA